MISSVESDSSALLALEAVLPSPDNISEIGNVAILEQIEALKEALNGISVIEFNTPLDCCSGCFDDGESTEWDDDEEEEDMDVDLDGHPLYEEL